MKSRIVAKDQCTKDMKMSQFTTLVLGATVSCTCGSALAAVETETETETINFNSDNPSSLTGSYTEFNSSLGTLRGVDIIISVSDTVQALVYSPDGSGYAYSNVSVQNGSETVSAFGDSVAGTSLATTPHSGTTTGVLTPVSGSTSTPFSGNFHASDLSSFIGTGLDTVAISVSPGSGLSSGSGTGSEVFFGAEFSVSGTIDIIYCYTPNMVTVPETRQFPLFTAGAAGVAGLCGLIRRTRRSKA
ncbi:MAG: choice-of-anchor E domain-containing protein [Verrucomicrobiae bacterium]|nr:choice-of-anchor E domain-containing protein [Verrucomicrobiae bacterium]